MSWFWKLALLGIVFGYYAACSPVEFSKEPEPPCGADGLLCVKTCTGDVCLKSYEIERRVGEGLVDILIVNDNSGSMSTEQAKMAERFPTFLDALGDLDYRIAMVTTDISSKYSRTPPNIRNDPAPANGNGKFQDGRLLEFAPGVNFLYRGIPNIESLFSKTVSRGETIDCEKNGYKDCPSGDERGIFAVNLALDRALQQEFNFMRPLAHLAVVILSDEDERGLSDKRSDQSKDDAIYRSLYPLEHYDTPETLVSRFKSKFPGKSMSAHPIIVKPGDKRCLADQTVQSGNPSIRGVEGYSYARLFELTGGTVGTICSNDYGAQLREIGYSLQEVPPLPFECRPVDDKYELTVDPPVPNLSQQPDFERLQLVVSGDFTPLTRLVLRYKCRDQ